MHFCHANASIVKNNFNFAKKQRARLRDGLGIVSDFTWLLINKQQWQFRIFWIEFKVFLLKVPAHHGRVRAAGLGGHDRRAESARKGRITVQGRDQVGVTPTSMLSKVNKRVFHSFKKGVDQTKEEDRV